MDESTTIPYTIKKGLSEKQISQLIEYAATDEGLKFTSDPKRFKDKESYDEFSKEIMAYYALTNEADDLLGIIWFHDLPLSVIARNDLPTDRQEVTKQSQSDDDAQLVNEGSEGSEIASGNSRNDEDMYGISFAIRLYREARGKGLAQPFTEEVLADFYESEEYKSHPHNKIWLAVSPENDPAVKLYHKLGFKDLKIDEEHKKLLMTLN